MSIRISTVNLDALRSSPSSRRDLSQPYRKGTWTTQEEQYVNALIEEFKHGHLSLQEGISLRNFLAKMVKCNPKRVSKKFEGINYNGKHSYKLSDQGLAPSEVLARGVRLQKLEDEFERSLVLLRAAEDAKKAEKDVQRSAKCRQSRRSSPEPRVRQVSAPSNAETLVPVPVDVTGTPAATRDLGSNTVHRSPSVLASNFSCVRPALLSNVGTLSAGPRVPVYVQMHGLNYRPTQGMDLLGRATVIAALNRAAALPRGAALSWPAASSPMMQPQPAFLLSRQERLHQMPGVSLLLAGAPTPRVSAEESRPVLAGLVSQSGPSPKKRKLFL